jgi:uncharacterized protein with LGFP repeats
MTDATVDLSQEGVHRDPTAHDPMSSGSFTQRLAHTVSRAISRRSSRRSFLTKTAIVGSALSVAPIDFLFKPGSAYAYTCGTCGDGWTAFCCTVNGGRNSCPSGSFVAGWWKADNAAYCCGAARYIIDCNASCPTSCSCRCAGASCDGRRTCCNQFRYGQCHQEISCYGPVVCRIATCTPPWRYDASCSTSSATDNKTVNHGAPCLAGCNPTPPPPPPSAIDNKYKALGGASGFLGRVTQREAAISGTSGRYAVYSNGRIYWTAVTGAHEIHGSLLTEHSHRSGVRGPLGFPTSDVRTTGDGLGRYSQFSDGRIIKWSQGTYSLWGTVYRKHLEHGSLDGVLGYPTMGMKSLSDGRGTYADFQRGRIYAVDRRARAIWGSPWTKFKTAASLLGYPISDVLSIGDGRGYVSMFERGFIFTSKTTGARITNGAVATRYIENDHARGYLRYPTTDVQNVGDGVGRFQVFERGRIYAKSGLGGFEVHGPIMDAWLSSTWGGPTGRLGYPKGEIVLRDQLRRQRFEGGVLQWDPSTGAITYEP